MIQIRRSVWFIAFLGVAFPWRTAHPQESVIKDVDAYVENVRAQFQVPGIAVAIVKDGKVVMAKGYGVRKLGDPALVDDRTLFAIASNTKAFTATALGILVEEGKLDWDAPVITYLPWFRLSNPYVTSNLKVIDVLVHRSGLGLGAGDLLWWPTSTYDRKEITRRLSNIPLATSFRSAYAYDNVLYLVAGELIEAVTGQSWEEFVSSRILQRVGMTESTVSGAEAQKRPDAATPHARVEGKVRVVTPLASENTNPAGGINSCAKDIAKWLIVQLDSGRVSDGSQLFSPQTAAKLWTLVTPIPIGRAAPGLENLQPNFNGYALGFNVRDYRGKKLVSHTGGLPGFVSIVAMIPAEKLGVAVLTNQESGAAFTAISRHVLDLYLGGEQVDWVGMLRRGQSRTDSLIAAAEKKVIAVRDSNSPPSLPLDKYAGTYVDAWYGEIMIAYNAGTLTIRFSHTPSLEGDLVHYQHDTFIARWSDREVRADAYVTFSLNPDGSIDQAKMKAVSPATDFSYDFQDLVLKPVRSGRGTQ